jgi:hypothetical protein
VRWRLGDGSLLSLAANLTDAPLTSQVATGEKLLWRIGGADNLSLAPWDVIWSRGEVT